MIAAIPIWAATAPVVWLGVLTPVACGFAAYAWLRRRRDGAALLTEIRVRRNAEHELAERLDFEKMVLGLSTRFIGIDAAEIDSAIAEGLGRLADALGADRAYVYRLPLGEGLAIRTHNFARRGIDPTSGFSESVDIKQFPWLLAGLSADRPLLYRAGIELPPAAVNLRLAIATRDTQALLVVPFGRGTPEQGCVALSASTTEPEWTDRTLGGVRLVGEIFGNALLRVRTASEREDADRERLQLEAQLRQAQKLESVGQLTGGVAHDFNNLLTIVIGNLELLQLTDGIDEEVFDLAGSALAAAHRGATLTQRLLAFARRQALQPKSIDARALVAGMHDMLARTLGEDISVELRSASNLRRCNADPSQLEQAILNLAINGRDAMPNGGRLQIECRLSEVDLSITELHPSMIPGEYVCISVADTGTGMPTDVVDRAFDPFFTTKEVGRGSGLGLSMVYGFAKQSGGSVTLHSEPRVGTTVRVYLPTSEEAPCDQEEVAQARLTFNGAGKKILVVEDEAGVRSLLERLLAGFGFDVVSAADGDEAIGWLHSARSFDLVLTDLVLPGGRSGVDVGNVAESLNPPPAVLYTSGYTEHRILRGARVAAGSEILEKPFTRTRLIEKVRDALSRTDVARAAAVVN